MTPEPGGAVKERVQPEARQEPALYKVVLLNDDYTPMEFVVDVLETVFQKSPAEAYRIMMQVHVQRPGHRRHLPVGSRRDEGRDGDDHGARGRISAARATIEEA